MMDRVLIGALHLLGLYSDAEIADTIPAPAAENTDEQESETDNE